MSFEQLLPLIFGAFVLMIKPGPYIFTQISLAAQGRWKAIFLFWFGYDFGAVLLYGFLLLSLSQLSVGTGILFLFLKSVAAIIFVTMGLLGIKDATRPQKEQALDKEKLESKQGVLALLAAGFALSLSNPYDIVFVTTVIPALVDQASFTLNDVIIIMAVIIAVGLFVLALYVLPVIFLRSLFSDSTLIKIKLISSWAMLAIGAYIFASMVLRWDLIAGQMLSG